jgi:ADP-ribose pyrophosphatase YjhB (NUDIX family)
LTRYFASDPTVVRLSVSAVVRRVREGEEILLMQRSDNGMWGLPGGHVEPGESVAAAALREVAEETGWRIELGRLIGVYSDPARQTVETARGERAQLVNLCFEALALEQHAPTTPHEALALGFFPRTRLPQPFVPIHTIRLDDAFAAEPGEAARVR